jgi:fused signal recognition particle receptor
MFDGIKETISSFRDSVDPADTDEPEAESSDDDREESDGVVRRARSLARGQIVIDEDDVSAPLERLQMELLANDVEMGVAEHITDQIRTELVGETRSVTTRTSSVVADAVEKALIDVLDVPGLDFDEFVESTDPPVVIIFTGVNGVGKTTTIAKIAQYLESQSYSLVLANADTFRAGANEQLAEHAERLGLKFISHEQGGDPAAVIYDAKE